MSSNPQDSFEAHFATLNLDERTLKLATDATIVPAELRAGHEPVELLRTLPRLATGEPAQGDTVDLQLQGTLGEGGMGLVRLARQVALGREVAVKTLRSRADDAAPKLLQEAYVTGRLEHPNIIPIYTLGQDTSGVPLIVMKRIEGVSWLEVLRDPSRAPNEAKVDLVWHLEILLQVCNAVRFAHRHHVIHRDIKPENVMLGLFGEVYLLDWGIAVSIADEAPGSALPHRRDVRGMAGTPAYMAPEMTQDFADEQDERTDIYLLGAVLYEILTGEPRHKGASLFDVLRSAFESHPVEFGPEVPAELAVVARRAMAKERGDRYQTVEEFSAAISAFLDHRGVLELLGQAERLLDELDARLAALPADLTLDEGDGQTQEELEIHDLFTECRFACRQALASWPESEHARAVHHRYLRTRFGYAVRRRDVVEARSIAAELAEAGLDEASMRDELKRLVDERSHEQEELRGLRALAADIDPRRGRFSRSAAILLMGFFWALETVRASWSWWQNPDLDRSASYIDAAWRVVAIGVIGMLLFRKPLFRTATNRRLAYVLLLGISGIALFRLIFALNPVDLVGVRALETAFYGFITAVVGLLSDDLRISALAVVYFVVAVLDAIYGPAVGFALVVAHVLAFGGTAWCWSKGQIDKRIRV